MPDFAPSCCRASPVTSAPVEVVSVNERGLKSTVLKRDGVLRDDVFSKSSRDFPDECGHLLHPGGVEVTDLQGGQSWARQHRVLSN